MIIRIVYLLLLLLKGTNSVSTWFEIKETPLKPMESMTLAGPNQKYVVQGEGGGFITYSIDWSTPLPTRVKTSVLGSSTLLDPPSLVQGDESFNVVLACKAVFRFNISPADPTGDEMYPLPTGKFYSYPFWAPGTVFMFVGTTDFPSPNRKLYRIYSDRITGLRLLV